MSIINQSKINQLIQEWPRGTVSVSSFLNSKGYSNSLQARYLKSKWIQSIGTGAYCLYNDKIDWQGGLYALQKQMNLDVHVGGKTAFELKGQAHFLRFKNKVFLFGQLKQNLPVWFNKFDWQETIVYTKTSLFPKEFNKYLSDFNHKEFSIVISSFERALFEMLYHVPNKVSFYEAEQITESLLSLRPEIVDDLLLNCNSIKIKRLVLYFAEKYSHPWFSKLKLKNIDLGKGKRQICKNGKLDSKYLITVSKDDNESDIP